MTSDPKPLPIPTYDLVYSGVFATPPRLDEADPSRDIGPGNWCRSADVRELVERLEKAEAQRHHAFSAIRGVVDHLRRVSGGAGEPNIQRMCEVLDRALAAIDKEDNA